MYRQTPLLKILYLLFIAAMLLPLAACNRAPKPVSFMVFGDPAEYAAYETLVAAFEAEHPEVDIELIHIPSQSDYRKRLAADLAAGTPADVVLINYRRYAQFAVQGALEPLAPYLAKSEVIAEQDFYPQSIAPFTWNGQLMCIPQNLSSLVVYYNKDLFAAAGVPEPADGWTWDDFLAAAKTLTRDTDGDGRIDQYGLGTEVSFLRLAPFIWQNGGEFVDDPYLPSFLTLNTPATQEAFQWFVDLQVKHHVVPDAAAEEAEDSESRFLNGRNAMHLQSRRIVPTLRESAAFDWDVAPLPQHKQAATVLHSDGYCMAATTQNKDAAWRLIEFANSSEGQQIVAATGRTVPSMRAVAESPVFLDPAAKPARSSVWLDVLPVLHNMPITATWIDVETIVDSELERAYYGQATVDEAIQAAMTRAQEYLVEAY